MPESFHCSDCGKEIDFLNTDRSTYCEECCPDHDYRYDAEERAHACRNCFRLAPPEWYED